MKKSKDIRLSQCMIVKNEEKNIERALSWGKDIVFEQIVVDTGSTDQTVELAKKMGAVVYSFEWIDDFAAAKNFAVSKAKGDWIAFLDADEYFSGEDTGTLLSLLTDLDKSTYYVMLTSLLNLDKEGRIFAGGIQTRIFKRIAGLQYRNRIHEELYLAGADLIDYTIDASEELAVYHTGYSGEEAKDKNKGDRNIRLILMELEEHPEDFNLMGYLADAYYAKGNDINKAEMWYRKAIDLMPDEFGEYDVRSNLTFIKLILLLCESGQENEFIEIYKRAVKAFPKESDYDCMLGRYYVKKQDYQKGAFYLERSINMLEKYGNVNKGALLTGSLQGTWELLALCHYQNGDLDKCVRWCITLLKSEKYSISTLVMMLCAFQTDEAQSKSVGAKAAGAEDIALFLGKLYELNSLKDRGFLIKAAMEARYDDLVKIMRGTCSAEELECFDQMMEI